MAAWAPRLWRPSDRVADVLRAMVERQLAAPDALCLAADDAVLLGVRRGAGLVVEHLESEGDDADVLARLLMYVAAEVGQVRVFTPLADEVRLRATEAAGLTATGRWWVRDLPVTLAVTGGRLAEPRPGYSLAPAPPLHDPGGPVAIIGRATSAQELVEIGVDAAARGGRVGVVIADAGSPLEALAADAAYGPVAEMRAG
ncbi:hypothetical protein [Nocardioides sp. SYSU DS0663]|uniref:hypothetical protein n=1 Tax=Nocardioides sp. SYSU DS0663 TaxID=3416445 RepID=UPI003F4BEE7E